jgi:hypothetical protein
MSEISKVSKLKPTSKPPDLPLGGEEIHLNNLLLLKDSNQFCPNSFLLVSCRLMKSTFSLFYEFMDELKFPGFGKPLAVPYYSFHSDTWLSH